ncbi:hypothetical protein Tco_1385149 [Tanacetum coccineum]
MSETEPTVSHRRVPFAKVYKKQLRNGRQEKKIVAIEDSNSKALVATDNNEDIDWTKEFDAEPTTFAMMALTEDDDTSVSLAFNGYNSECTLLVPNVGIDIEEKQKELDQALKERDDFKVKLEKWTNASVLQNEVLNKQRYVSDKSCIGFGIESSNSMESDISSGDGTLTDSVDDEETDVSESQKETAFNSENSETSFENRSPNSQNSVGQESRTKGLGTTGGQSPEEDLKDYASITVVLSLEV